MGKPKGKYIEQLVAFNATDRRYLERLSRMIRKETGANLGMRVIVRAMVTAVRHAVGTGSGITGVHNEEELANLLRTIINRGAELAQWPASNGQVVHDG